MKNFIMLIVLTTLVVAISACNTENPITSDNEGNNNTPVFVENWDPNPTTTCDYYHREKRNGGPQGYEYVIKDKSIFGTIIICQLPGTKYCPREAVGGSTPENGIPTSDMLNASNHAYHEILSGNLVGLESFPETGLTVRWSSTTPDTILGTSDVKVWETSGTEPNN